MNKNILLVEYDESTVAAIKELLSLPEIEITVVSDGESALRLLAKKPFDLVITAAMLPRFHGFKLCQDVISQYPGVPVVIISAIYKGLQYRHMAVTQYNAADFFEKPLEKDRFKFRILELLNLMVKPEARTAASARKAKAPPETVKFPAKWDEKEREKKISSQDIFGDIIEQVEGGPAFEVQVEENPAATRVPFSDKPAPAAKREIPVPEAPKFQEPYLKHEADGKKPDDHTEPEIFIPPPETHFPVIKEEVVELRIEDSIAQKAKPKAMKLEPATAMLSDLEKKVKTQKIAVPQALKEKKTDTMPFDVNELLKRREITPGGARLKKIEDDIMKKLDDTLSGLGFPGAAKSKTTARERGVFTGPKEDARAAKPTDEDWDYDILGLIARGGMAEIYKAKKRGHKGFEKIIAIKKILSGYGEDDKYIEMLIDEAKVAAQLSHPNIVHIYDLKKKDSFYFIVMEYVLGKDLRIILRVLQEHNRLLPEDLAIYVVIKILEALNYAHKATDNNGKRLDIVHRDVSPPNILISYNGDVKLADFGISKASIKIHQTVSGALKGKLLYMSPEQALGEENIDYRSDLYSVGLILFELLTGKKQFMDRTEMGILKKVQTGHVTPPREVNHDVDQRLDAIIVKCLQRDKDKRYQSAADLNGDLQSYLLKKYNYFPTPIHLAQLLADLFQDEIRKEGIKGEPRPVPPAAKKVEKPEEPKPPPAEVKAIPPPEIKITPPPVVKTMPPPEMKAEPPPESKFVPPVRVQAPPARPQPMPPPAKPQPMPGKAPPPPPLDEKFIPEKRVIPDKKVVPEKKIVEINLDDDLEASGKHLQDDDLIITITSSGIVKDKRKPEPDKIKSELDKRKSEKDRKPEKPKKGWFFK